MSVHNHGTEDGPGLACRERIISGKLKGDCMGIELTPEKLREAANVVEEYNIRCKGTDPDLIARNPATLRRIAGQLEAENAEKAERDRAIEELVADMYPTDYVSSIRDRAIRLYDKGWRKQSE